VGHRPLADAGGRRHNGLRRLRPLAGGLALGGRRAGDALGGGRRRVARRVVAGPVRPRGRPDAACGFGLPAVAAAGVASRGDLTGDGRGDGPLALRRVRAGVRVPHHGLRGPHDPVPQRPRRARGLLPRRPETGPAEDGL
ncbi:MAG: hypothetical protein AVDCRST_MAG12-3582, partial [uncultured Rubrobacteraceae bacterium]